MIAVGRGEKKNSIVFDSVAHKICRRECYLQDKELKINKTVDPDVACPALQLEKHNVSRGEQHWFQSTDKPATTVEPNFAQEIGANFDVTYGRDFGSTFNGVGAHQSKKLGTQAKKKDPV